MSVCLFVSVAGWLAGELHLTPVNRFCYLGSYLSNTISVDIDRSTQPCIPPGSLNRVPALVGVRAGMSPLPGGR